VDRGVRDGARLLDDDRRAARRLLGAGARRGALLELAPTRRAVDDNPISEHVLKGTASKSLAKTAWLFHLAGSEALLGSHGLETESWVAESLDS
jgi:hypothetical protein